MFNINPGLAIWTVITFMFLLLVLRLFAWKPLLMALENRENRIRGSLEDAEKARVEAEKQLEEYKKMIQMAKEESDKIINEGIEKAEQKKNEIIKEAKGEAEKLVENAKKEIELQKDKVLDELKVQAANLSVMTASRFISAKISQQDQEKIVSEAIKELGELQ
jgi:F-type H+-transporting ATPase subunit b